MDRWLRVDGDHEDRPSRRGPPRPGRSPRQGRPGSDPTPLPAEVVAALRKAARGATERHREALVAKAADAFLAYERARFQDAARLAKQVATEVPSVPPVRELAGLAAYRSGRWREAVRQLEAYGELADDVEHMPALMDCYRALGRRAKVADLWSELRRRSPGPDVLVEARIVAAATLAESGDLGGAVALLVSSGAGKALRNPSGRHVRQWYVLGDLYERAGDLPRARELLERVYRADPEAYDVADRLAALGGGRPRRRRAPASGERARSGGRRAERPR
jgi:tetratricopeptide (TPR) repeat protein